VATLRLEIVTAERMVYSDDVHMVIVWGLEGQLGILPHHASLMTMLQPGELIIKKDSEESYLAVSGGFLEVRPPPPLSQRPLLLRLLFGAHW